MDTMNPDMADTFLCMLISDHVDITLFIIICLLNQLTNHIMQNSGDIHLSSLLVMGIKKIVGPGNIIISRGNIKAKY